MPPFNRQPVAAANPQLSSMELLLTRIIALIDEMVALMNEEIPIVEGRKRALHAELLKRKQRLTLDYRASLKAIVLEPELLQQVPETLRGQARAAAERLAEASNRNARALRSIITASQRLVQTIVTIVKQEVLPQAAYTNAATSKMTSGYSPTCKPVTVYKSA